VSELTWWPMATSASARRPVDFDVQRSGHMGSPRAPGSTKLTDGVSRL
jgi:hypothetical protein